MAIVSATRLLDVTEDDHRLGRTLDSELGTLGAQPQAMVHAMVRCDGMVLVRHDRRLGAQSARAIMVRCDGMVLGVW